MRKTHKGREFSISSPIFIRREWEERERESLKEENETEKRENRKKKSDWQKSIRGVLRPLRCARSSSCDHWMSNMRKWLGIRSRGRVVFCGHSLATWTTIPSECFAFVFAMRCWSWRRFDGSFEDGVIGRWKGIPIISIRPPIEGGIESADVDALTYTTDFPIVKWFRFFKAFIHIFQTRVRWPSIRLRNLQLGPGTLNQGLGPSSRAGNLKKGQWPSINSRDSNLGLRIGPIFTPSCC